MSEEECFVDKGSEINGKQSVSTVNDYLKTSKTIDNKSDNDLKKLKTMEATSIQDGIIKTRMYLQDSLVEIETNEAVTELNNKPESVLEAQEVFDDEPISECIVCGECILSSDKSKHRNH